MTLAKAAKEVLVELEKKINAAADGLKNVVEKRMFGCHALFAKDAVFGLVWKEGRIGVRLPDEAAFGELMALKGAAPWKAGAMTMSHWVLVPPAMHDDGRSLAKWVTKAHGIAASSPKAGPARAKKKTKAAGSKKARMSTKKKTKRV